MPDYATDGTENLRASPTVKTSSTVNASPSGAGKDLGGTENMKADFKVITSSQVDRVTPGQKSIDIPRGVQHFDDDMGKN